MFRVCLRQIISSASSRHSTDLWLRGQRSPSFLRSNLSVQVWRCQKFVQTWWRNFAKCFTSPTTVKIRSETERFERCCCVAIFRVTCCYVTVGRQHLSSVTSARVASCLQVHFPLFLCFLVEFNFFCVRSYLVVQLVNLLTMSYELVVR